MKRMNHKNFWILILAVTLSGDQAQGASSEWVQKLEQCTENIASINSALQNGTPDRKIDPAQSPLAVGASSQEVEAFQKNLSVQPPKIKDFVFKIANWIRSPQKAAEDQRLIDLGKQVEDDARELGIEVTQYPQWMKKVDKVLQKHAINSSNNLDEILSDYFKNENIKDQVESFIERADQEHRRTESMINTDLENQSQIIQKRLKDRRNTPNLSSKSSSKIGSVTPNTPESMNTSQFLPPISEVQNNNLESTAENSLLVSQERQSAQIAQTQETLKGQSATPDTTSAVPLEQNLEKTSQTEEQKEAEPSNTTTPASTPEPQSAQIAQTQETLKGQSATPDTTSAVPLEQNLEKTSQTEEQKEAEPSNTTTPASTQERQSEQTPQKQELKQENPANIPAPVPNQDQETALVTLLQSFPDFKEKLTEENLKSFLSKIQENLNNNKNFDSQSIPGLFEFKDSTLFSKKSANKPLKQSASQPLKPEQIPAILKEHSVFKERAEGLMDALSKIVKFQALEKKLVELLQSSPHFKEKLTEANLKSFLSKIQENLNNNKNFDLQSIPDLFKFTDKTKQILLKPDAIPAILHQYPTFQERAEGLMDALSTILKPEKVKVPTTNYQVPKKKVKKSYNGI